MCIYRKRLKKYFHRLWLKLLTLILVCVHYSIFGVLVFTFLFILDEHFVFVVHIINFTFRREREKKNMYVYTIRCIGSIRNNTASKEKNNTIFLFAFNSHTDIDSSLRMSNVFFSLSVKTTLSELFSIAKQQKFLGFEPNFFMHH